MPCGGRALREPPNDWRAGTFPSGRKGPGGGDLGETFTRLGGPRQGGLCGWSLGPPPAEEMDEDGLPLMGSGIDLTKVCKGRSWTSGDLGGGWGRDTRCPGGPHLPCLTLSLAPGFSSAGLGRESPTLHLEKGSLPSCLRGSCTSPSPRFTGLYAQGDMGRLRTLTPPLLLGPQVFCVFMCAVFTDKFLLVNPEPILKLFCSFCHLQTPHPHDLGTQTKDCLLAVLKGLVSHSS